MNLKDQLLNWSTTMKNVRCNSNRHSFSCQIGIRRHGITKNNIASLASPGGCRLNKTCLRSLTIVAHVGLPPQFAGNRRADCYHRPILKKSFGIKLAWIFAVPTAYKGISKGVLVRTTFPLKIHDAIHKPRRRSVLTTRKTSLGVSKNSVVWLTKSSGVSPATRRRTKVIALSK